MSLLIGTLAAWAAWFMTSSFLLGQGFDEPAFWFRLVASACIGIVVASFYEAVRKR